MDLLHAQIQALETEIIILTEIKPKNGKIPDCKLLEIDGYTLHMSNIEAPDTRGVCIYVDNKFKSVEVKGKHNYNDAVWVSIYGDNQQHKVLVGGVYRSGTPSTAIKYDENLNEMMTTMSNLPHYMQTYCFGDFNYNTIKWSPQPIPPNDKAADSPEFKFTECIRDTYMYQHITEPTRYREGNRPTLDDLVFSSEQNSITRITHQSCLGKSDHEAITCEILTEPMTASNTKTSYAYDRGNYNQMRNILNIDWESRLEGLSTQEAMDSFENLYNQAVDQCVPKKQYFRSKKPKPLWMNKHAMRKCRKKHSSWIRYLNTKSGEDYRNYIRERNAANKEVRRLRRGFEMNIAKDCKKNSKGVWNYIKKQRKSGSSMPDLKRKDGTFTSNDEEAAETLNEQYFDTFTKEDTTNIPDIESKPLQTDPLSTFNVTRDRVLKVIRNLKVNKSPGIDKIHPRVLKEMDETISYPVTIIYKKSIEESKLPRQWKDAEITPIYKKEAKNLPQNYRPVSLTSVICKILEKLVVEDIINHVKTNLLSCKEQHGFTAKKNTTTNLLEALNIITEAEMHGLPVDVLFLDYQKAFDTVPHRRLIQQVESFGITDKALKWIIEFLSDRRQRVRVNNNISSWKPVLSGIPQGSILGPILFILFVNDIPELIKSIILMYADDTKLISAILSDSPTNSLASDLKLLEEWSEKFQMKFHPNKCHVMHFGSKNPMHDYTMRKDNELHTLEKVSSEKDLGITIDNKLKFSEHINAKINKANQIVGCIKYSFKYLNKDIFKLLYKSMIRPHLEYGSVIWSPHLKKHMDAIERVQRRATKLVSEIKHLSYNDRLRALDLPTLKFRRDRADLIETYNILTQKHLLDTHCHCHLCPDKQMFQRSLSTVTRGHSMKLQHQNATGSRYHFLATRVINSWNSLSESTVTQPTLQKFKTELHKQWDQNKEVYYQYTFSY